MNKDLLKKLDAIKGKPPRHEYTKEQDEVILLSRTPKYSVTFPNLAKLFKSEFGLDMPATTLKDRYYKLKAQGK